MGISNHISQAHHINLKNPSCLPSASSSLAPINQNQTNSARLGEQKKAKKKLLKKRKMRQKGHEAVDFENNDSGMVEGKKSKLSQTNGIKRRRKDVASVSAVEDGEEEDVKTADNLISDGKVKKLSKKKKMQKKEKNSVSIGKGEDGAICNQKDGKAKKHRKKKNKDRCKENGNNLMEKRNQTDQDEVYRISAMDEDCSKGMKKWINEYHDSRPGLKILEQRIDDFILAHEARLEEEKKEKKALAEEEGWTVVEHHKGRKKTTDTETGTTVGSVAQAVVEDKMAKKKHKGVGLEFYRFQKKEARRNEILALQSKFEQDKKRIEQLRAARKFRPY